MEEYDYSKKSWIVENLDGSDDLLKDENWANTSLGHSDASTFPVFHDALALQLVKKGPSLATVYKAETKIMSLRYSTRTCRVGEETNEILRKCEKANVLCKTGNGTIFEIADLEFDQRNEACLNENATFCEFTLCIFIWTSDCLFQILHLWWILKRGTIPMRNQLFGPIITESTVLISRAIR